MSEKEYKIEVNGDYVKISEVEQRDYGPNTDPTMRENLNDKLSNMPKGGKIALTLLFDLYGILFRFSANTTIAFLFSFVHFFSNIIVIYCIESFGFTIPSETDEEFIFVSAFTILALVMWLIDLFSIIKCGKITFLKNKTYKNYDE